MDDRTLHSLHTQIKRLQLYSDRLVEDLLSGNYRSVFKGLGIEFDEVRDYVYGDDARMIDWNVTGRLGAPFTKTFREERELTLFLIVDLSASVVGGEVAGERRRVQSMLTALLTFAAVRNNDQLGAIFFSDGIEAFVRPAKGKKHALRLLQDGLRLEPAGVGSNLSLALRTAAETLNHRGICIVLSDFKTEGYWRDLSLLSRKHDVIACRITDDSTRGVLEGGLMYVMDQETGQSQPVLGRSRTYRREYQEFWDSHWHQWRANCRRRRVSLLEISTQDDPALKLIQFFRRRRR
ncbi:DUF58 domain-containing protein [Spirochaeta africana]|uniref:DUF58 domain-containing protein n=1 Tax=Spirochaeta africana (strain ATCC 700263 / DSM 8902 / Z-7692) TaxID=889378 RepID=H9UM23_SPIAZ|nr:DUF58 domain-containing protein [Spirochaeta africana]AFG38566.1 hypothetical protein Spiaf_2536 [Spirochaeta africana DSM 8902]